MSAIVACPFCGRKLRVPPELTGNPVKCPACLKAFDPPAGVDLPLDRPAAAADLPLERAPRSDRSPERKPALDRGPDLPASRRVRSRDDDEDDEDDDRPRRRRRADEEDDYDDRDDRPRRRRRRYTDHRGSTILALGICAVLGFFTIVTGPMAWIMGSNDLAEIRRGEMDPEGETNTRVGMYLGMAATILMIVALVLICGFGGVMMVVSAR